MWTHTECFPFVKQVTSVVDQYHFHCINFNIDTVFFLFVYQVILTLKEENSFFNQVWLPWNWGASRWLGRGVIWMWFIITCIIGSASMSCQICTFDRPNDPQVFRLIRLSDLFNSRIKAKHCKGAILPVCQLTCTQDLGLVRLLSRTHVVGHEVWVRCSHPW